MVDLTRLFQSKDNFKKVQFKKNDVIPVAVDQIRPSQFCVGEWEVQHHLSELQDLIPKGSELIRTHLQKELVKVVAGPEGVFYLVDGHHFARALLAAGIPEVYAVVSKNWTDTKPEKFRARVKGEFFYPRDYLGKKAKFKELPEHLSKMQNDPYRSLAWLGVEIGAYKKVDKPHASFAWAEYFRKLIELPERPSASDLKSAAALIVELSQGKKARKLPGYIKLRDSSHELLLNRMKTTLQRLKI